MTRRIARASLPEHRYDLEALSNIPAFAVEFKGGRHMKTRYRQRIPLKFPVVFTVGAHSGEGRVLDLTIPGCLIESPVTVQKDQSVELTIHLPGLKRPLTVGLGVVRWTNGKQFGVEFIRMEESQVVLLRRFMAQHLSDLASAKTKQNVLKEPGGSNWHLETYSISNGP